MARVVAFAAVSLDGFVARSDDDPGPIFDWYENGDVPYAGDPERVFHMSRASANFLGTIWPEIRAEVIGRRLFDLINGWDGRPPMGGDRVFVVTHESPTDWPFPDAPFTFVTDGLESAVEQAHSIAGDGIVSLTGGDLCGQALALGLVDEISVQVAPVVLGSGIRFFGDFAGPEIMLENPRVVEGDRVTHLHYRVRRTS